LGEGGDEHLEADELHPVAAVGDELGDEDAAIVGMAQDAEAAGVVRADVVRAGVVRADVVRGC